MKAQLRLCECVRVCVVVCVGLREEEREITSTCLCSFYQSVSLITTISHHIVICRRFQLPSLTKIVEKHRVREVGPVQGWSPWDQGTGVTVQEDYP